MSQTADSAEVTLDSGDMIKAQYVVASDGMNSTIRELAGLGHQGNDALLRRSVRPKRKVRRNVGRFVRGG